MFSNTSGISIFSCFLFLSASSDKELDMFCDFASSFFFTGDSGFYISIDFDIFLLTFKEFFTGDLFGLLSGEYGVLLLLKLPCRCSFVSSVCFTFLMDMWLVEETLPVLCSDISDNFESAICDSLIMDFGSDSFSDVSSFGKSLNLF